MKSRVVKYVGEGGTRTLTPQKRTPAKLPTESQNIGTVLPTDNPEQEGVWKCKSRLGKTTTEVVEVVTEKYRFKFRRKIREDSNPGADLQAGDGRQGGTKGVKTPSCDNSPPLLIASSNPGVNVQGKEDSKTQVQGRVGSRSMEGNPTTPTDKIKQNVTKRWRHAGGSKYPSIHKNLPYTDSKAGVKVTDKHIKIAKEKVVKMVVILRTRVILLK